MNELRNSGVKDILLAAVDGVTGFSEAINSVFPKTEAQLCMVRSSLKYVPYKDRKALTADLKEIWIIPLPVYKKISTKYTDKERKKGKENQRKTDLHKGYQDRSSCIGGKERETNKPSSKGFRSQ